MRTFKTIFVLTIVFFCVSCLHLQKSAGLESVPVNTAFLQTPEDQAASDRIWEEKRLEELRLSALVRLEEWKQSSISPQSPNDEAQLNFARRGEARNILHDLMIVMAAHPETKPDFDQAFHTILDDFEQRGICALIRFPSFFETRLEPLLIQPYNREVFEVQVAGFREFGLDPFRRYDYCVLSQLQDAGKDFDFFLEDACLSPIFLSKFSSSAEDVGLSPQEERSVQLFVADLMLYLSVPSSQESRNQDLFSSMVDSVIEAAALRTYVEKEDWGALHAFNEYEKDQALKASEKQLSGLLEDGEKNCVEAIDVVESVFRAFRRAGFSDAEIASKLGPVAQRAEDQGQYDLALVLYSRLGNAEGAARVRPNSSLFR